jgi:hypothetical protein
VDRDAAARAQPPDGPRRQARPDRELRRARGDAHRDLGEVQQDRLDSDLAAAGLERVASYTDPQRMFGVTVARAA